MDRDDRGPRLRLFVPLFVMVCGACAIAVVVLGVLWISDQPFAGLGQGLPPAMAEGTNQ
jgi:hypothetical protein